MRPHVVTWLHDWYRLPFLFRIISTKWDCFIMFFQGVPSVYGRVFGWSVGFLQLPEVKNMQFLVVHFFSYPWCREVILGILGFTFGIYGPTLDQRKGLFSEVTGLLPTLLLQDSLGPQSHDSGQVYRTGCFACASERWLPPLVPCLGMMVYHVDVINLTFDWIMKMCQQHEIGRRHYFFWLVVWNIFYFPIYWE